MLGHQKVGSFALSSDKTELFSVAISSFLDVICETYGGCSNIDTDKVLGGSGGFDYL